MMKLRIICFFAAVGRDGRAASRARPEQPALPEPLAGLRLLFPPNRRAGGDRYDCGKSGRGPGQLYSQSRAEPGWLVRQHANR